MRVEKTKRVTGPMPPPPLPCPASQGEQEQREQCEHGFTEYHLPASNSLINSAILCPVSASAVFAHM